MNKEIATKITNDINLIAILTEMESCRINEIPKHKFSVYRSGKAYNVICNHELKKYLIEINNNKSGAEAFDERYEVDFGFSALLTK